MVQSKVKYVCSISGLLGGTYILVRSQFEAIKQKGRMFQEKMTMLVILNFQGTAQAQSLLEAEPKKKKK